MLQAALAGGPFGLPIWGLYVRLPFQLVFIAWAWFVRDVERESERFFVALILE